MDIVLVRHLEFTKLEFPKLQIMDFSYFIDYYESVCKSLHLPDIETVFSGHSEQLKAPLLLYVLSGHIVQ